MIAKRPISTPALYYSRCHCARGYASCKRRGPHTDHAQLILRRHEQHSLTWHSSASRFHDSGEKVGCLTYRSGMEECVAERMAWLRQLGNSTVVSTRACQWRCHSTSSVFLFCSLAHLQAELSEPLWSSSVRTSHTDCWPSSKKPVFVRRYNILYMGV